MASSLQISASSALSMVEAKPFLGSKLPFARSISARPKSLCTFSVRAATAVTSKVTNSNLTHLVQILDSCGQMSWWQPKVYARITASLDKDEGKTDGARKALEQMFQGKTNLSKKWEEEIKKRELAGSDGGGGGGSGWGGGGGGGDDMGEDYGGGGQGDSVDWEEVGQTFMATFVLIILYFSITHGPKQVFRLFKLFFRYVRNGFRFRVIPEEYLRPGPGEVDSDEEDGDIIADSNEDDEAFVTRLQKASDRHETNVEDNYDEADESEEEMLSPPTKYKKQNQIAQLQAESREKAMQRYMPKGQRGNGDK